MTTKQEKKKFYFFLGFLFVLVGLGIFGGYQICKTEHKKDFENLSYEVDKLICERDSLLKLYYAGDIILQKQMDSIKVINADRKVWKSRYYNMIRKPLPARSKELENEIKELLILIRSEVLPDRGGVPGG